MKKHTLTAWMAFIAIITLCTANAQPQPTAKPKPTPTAIATIPAAPTLNAEMVPYLIAFNSAGAIVKKERLASNISGADTLYYDQRGNQIKKKDVVRWLPKYNNDLEKLLASTKAMDVRTWYGVILGYGYEKPQADSLAKKVVTVIRGKSDSRPLISSIYENSPNTSRLNALEATDLELRVLISALDTKLDNLPAPDMSRFVEIDTFKVFRDTTRYALCMQDTMNALLNTGLAAVDEQLSTTRGKRWEEMKVKHGVVQYFDAIQSLTMPEQPVTEQATLKALPPAKEKSTRGAMPRPTNF